MNINELKITFAGMGGWINPRPEQLTIFTLNNNKYYTPTIDEFHVGFEFEFLGADRKTWYKQILGSLAEFNGYEPGECYIKDHIEYGNMKVKYLDKEDIESLGWYIIWEEYKSYGTYYKAKGKNTELWYAKLNGKDPYVVLTTKYYNGNTRATIKNKSELKKLMKQLAINE